MYFTSGSDRAFEQLMQGKPGFDHYDSGEAVTPEDCGTCRFYRPHWKYQFCVYAECPYQPGKLTAYDAVTFRVKGVENMAVFRVERNKGYTVMSNHHLRNKDLSLKAKGLLSQMLSLPEDWDYTLKGLSLINREQIDAIRAAIRELEQAGYIVRSRERDSQGRLRGADYVIYEQPQPVPDSPTLENPMLDNPTQEKPTLGKPTQLNGRSLRIPMKPLSTSRPLIWRRKSAAMYGVIQTAGAKRLPSQDCSIVPIAAARCMSTAPTMARGFLNIPVPIIPKFRVGHYAIHNTVSMRVLF